MRFTTLDDWLAWLEQLHPKEIDLGLDRIAQVAERMDLPKPAKRVVSVAGTNGKGSTIAALESVCVTADINVGSYTSPHLLHYGERIKINAVPVADELICQAFSRVDSARLDKARGEISLSYFEFGTLAALAIFADYGLDIALLEVGLGGRLDAVNIVDADIAVITRIDIDHVDWLGADRETIAVEKAGIMRPSVPVVCADSNPPASLLAVAEQLACRCYQYGRDFFLEDAGNSSSDNWRWCECRGCSDIIAGKGGSGESAKAENTLYESPCITGFNNQVLPLPSLAAAIQVVKLLDFPVSDEQLCRGINQAELAGRRQKIILDDFEVLLDVAHNTASAAYLADYLRAYPVAANTVAVFAAMADKDIAGIISVLKEQIDHWSIADLDVTRAAKASEINNLLQRQGATAITMNASVEQSFLQAKSLCKANGRIVVFGSFFTVSDVLQQLNPQ